MFRLQYSNIRSFDSSISRSAPTSFRYSYSNPFSFNNNGSGIVTKKEYRLNYTGIRLFNNDSFARASIPDLNFSYGIFDFTQYYDYPYNDNLFYKDFDEVITKKDSRFSYEFNNNMPSMSTAYQMRIIPWGYGTAIYEMAINFPQYKLNVEVDVPFISTGYTANLETALYLPVDEYRTLNTEWQTTFMYSTLNIEMGQITAADKYNLNSEVLATRAQPNYRLNSEVMVFLAREKPLTVEADIGWEYYPNTEFFSSINKDFVLNQEFMVYKEKDKTLNTQYEMVYHDVDTIQSEVDVYGINMDSQVQSEFNIINITQPKYLNTQFEMVYIEPTYLNTEVDVENITQSTVFNLEGLYQAVYDTKLNIEVDKSVDISVYYQLKVAPIKVRDVVYQLLIIATLDDKLNVEIDVDNISAQYRINLEANIVRILDEHFNTEFTTDITSNSTINTQADVGINLDTPLNAEFMTELTIQDVLNSEFWIDFTTEKMVNVEAFVESVTKNEHLNVQVDTEIQAYIQLVVEAFVDTISTGIALEFDVLDLVYYFMRRGYNIIPWIYSALTGYWDTNSTKNWNKDEVPTTVESGLLNQLQDLGLIKPECITLSDRNFDNYGMVIPLENKFINSEIGDRFTMFESVNDDTVIVLGRRSVKPSTTIKAGRNIYVYEGTYDSSNELMFNDIVRPQLNHECIMVWNPLSGTWKNITNPLEDHPLYFKYEYDGQEHMMPYIFILESNEDRLIVNS